MNIKKYIKDIATLMLFLIIILIIIFSGNFTSSTAKIELDRTITSDVFDKFEEGIFLIFFGYVGCDDVCTPRLQESVPIYNELKSRGRNDLRFIFINLIYLKDKGLPDLFAKAFHKDFAGLYLEGEELNGLMSQFGVFNVPSFTQKGEFDHTSFLFLVQKKEKEIVLRRIYTNTPFDKEKIVNDILENF